jgi:hypothetical protein
MEEVDIKHIEPIEGEEAPSPLEHHPNKGDLDDYRPDEEMELDLSLLNPQSVEADDIDDLSYGPSDE